MGQYDIVGFIAILSMLYSKTQSKNIDKYGGNPQCP